VLLHVCSWSSHVPQLDLARIMLVDSAALRLRADAHRLQHPPFRRTLPASPTVQTPASCKHSSFRHPPAAALTVQIPTTCDTRRSGAHQLLLTPTVMKSSNKYIARSRFPSTVPLPRTSRLRCSYTHCSATAASVCYTVHTFAVVFSRWH
jgi:hypothetical protein